MNRVVQTTMRRLLALAIALLAPSLFASEITRANVLAQMNVHRSSAGLLPLTQDIRLNLAAEDRIRDMEEQGYWSHVGPDGRSPFEWLRPRGYEFAVAGENLASGFDTAEVLVEAWMESKGHRENILAPYYRECGLAIIDGSTTGRASGRSVVVLFGARRGPAQQASR